MGAVLPARGGGACSTRWAVLRDPFSGLCPGPHPRSRSPPAHSMARHVFLTGPPGNPAGSPPLGGRRVGVGARAGGAAGSRALGAWSLNGYGIAGSVLRSLRILSQKAGF